MFVAACTRRAIRGRAHPSAWPSVQTLALLRARHRMLIARRGITHTESSSKLVCEITSEAARRTRCIRGIVLFGHTSVRTGWGVRGRDGGRCSGRRDCTRGNDHNDSQQNVERLVSVTRSQSSGFRGATASLNTALFRSHAATVLLAGGVLLPAGRSHSALGCLQG